MPVFLTHSLLLFQHSLMLFCCNTSQKLLYMLFCYFWFFLEGDTQLKVFKTPGNVWLFQPKIQAKPTSWKMPNPFKASLILILVVYCQEKKKHNSILKRNYRQGLRLHPHSHKLCEKYSVHRGADSLLTKRAFASGQYQPNINTHQIHLVLKVDYKIFTLREQCS